MTDDVNIVIYIGTSEYTYAMSNSFFDCFLHTNINSSAVFVSTHYSSIAQPGFLEQWANLHYDQKVEWAK